MNRIEYLLTCLIEEAAEIQKAATKAQRFGLGDSPPDVVRPTTNQDDLVAEIADLIGVVTLMEQELGISIVPDPDDLRVQAKIIKVRRFMDYSRTRGTLTET